MTLSTEGTVTFQSRFLPGLAAGEYQVTCSQSLTNAGEEVADSNNYLTPLTQSFEVRAPRFSLPSTDVLSVYPPNAARGHFSGVLPQVVLSDPTLPWARRIDVHEARDIPWMALLLLRESELIANDDASGDRLLRHSTVSEFLEEEDGVLKPDIDRDLLDKKTAAERCISIRIHAADFGTLMPEVDNLSYLTHCRTTGIDDDASTVATLIANRLALPQGDGKGRGYRACLVSLEGCEQLKAACAADTTGKQQVGLIVLHSWSFTSVMEKRYFETLAEHLATEQDGVQPLLSVPVAATASGEAAARVRAGYVALASKTRAGPDTFAWYSGPLAPLARNPLPSFAHKTSDFSVDSWRVYDPAHALFDQSYASAWQLGRSLALADGVFGADLLALRRALAEEASKLDQKICILAKTDPDQLASGDAETLLASASMQQRFLTLAKDPQFWSPPATAPAQSGAPAPAPTPPSGSPAASQRALLAQAKVCELLRGQLKAAHPEVLARVNQWLEQLTQLEFVPFWYLVPDTAMLPEESIRFFMVDQGWLFALRAGALSVGIQSSKDTLLHACLITAIDKGAAPVAGFLLRSALVSSFPKLNLIAEAGAGEPTTVESLRQLHPSRNILLQLYPQRFDSLVIGEPKHSLCFGMLEERTEPPANQSAAAKSAAQPERFIELRHLSGETGAQIKAADADAVLEPVKFPMNDYVADNGVLDMPAIAAALAKKLKGESHAAAALTPSELAIELLSAPAAVRFSWPADAADATDPSR